MRSEQERVRVTLVTGSDAVLRRRMQAVIADERWTVGDAGPGTADSLAAAVSAAARAGLDGALALSLHPSLDPLETALVLQQHWAMEHPAARVRLSDVITVAHARELRALLHEGGAHDLDAPEASAQRIEAATAIVVAGGDDPRLRHLVRALNPRSPVLDERGLDRSRYRGVLRAPVDDLGRCQGWMLALRGALLSGPAVDVVVFRDPRPFHPYRLAEVVERGLSPSRVGTIWRSRGLVRLASRVERVGSWCTAGEVLRLDPTTMTSDDPEAPAGQELVLMGSGLRRAAIVDALGSALLTPGELLEGPMAWAGYADPFPAWQSAHGH